MTTKGRGRPRSAEVGAAILDAARDLITSGGYERMTMEAIAATAGVGKQTVYRRWPSKAAIVAEAVMSGRLALDAAPPEDTGDAAEDLLRWLDLQFHRLEDPAAAAIIRGLAAAATDGGTDADRLYDRFTGPSREELRLRLAAGVELGQFRAGLDTGAAADAISGMMLYRALVPPSARSASSTEGLIDLLLNGMTPRRSGSGRESAEVQPE